MPSPRKGVFYWTENLVNGLTQCNVFHTTNPTPICRTRSPKMAQSICQALANSTQPQRPAPTLFPQQRSGEQHWRI